MDCEWKPSFGLQKNELSLMQIATHKSVFILDVIELGSKVAHLWQELGKYLFNNCDILKLGELLGVQKCPGKLRVDNVAEAPGVSN